MSGELKSEFLDEFYSQKLTPRDILNLRDPEGPRLSHYWQYSLISHIQLI